MSCIEGPNIATGSSSASSCLTDQTSLHQIVGAKPTLRPTRIRAIPMIHGIDFNNRLVDRKLEDYNNNDGNSLIQTNANATETTSSLKSRVLLNQDYIDTDTSYDLNEYYLYGKDVMADYTSWYTGDRDGSDFHISDMNGNLLYYTGTLCASTSDETPCDLSALLPGEYAWRVTGALNPNRMFVTYDFCGIRGSYSTEIIFEVDCDYECVPVRVRNMDQICYEEEEVQEAGYEGNETKPSNEGGTPSISSKPRITARPRLISTLHGSVHIETMHGLELTGVDRAAIRATLGGEFNDASKGDSSFQDIVEILPSSSVHSSSITSSSISGVRHLKLLHLIDDINVYQIDFKVSLVSENYGVDGSRREEVNALANDLFEYLHHSMNNGLFVSKLISIGRSEGLSSLSSVRTVRISHLIVSDEMTINRNWLDVKDATCILVICMIMLLVLVMRRRKVLQLRVREGHISNDVMQKYDVQSNMYPGRIHDVIIHNEIDKCYRENHI